VRAALAGRTLDGSGEDDGESLEAQANGDAVSDNGEEPAVSGLRSRLNLYAVHVEGRTPSGAVFARDAVFRVTGDPKIPFQLLEWRQGKRNLFTDDDLEND
jgi:hypothetical protein